MNRFVACGLVAATAIALLLSPAWAGKKDDTLYIALEKELENVDRYFNTAREGIIFARHVYDNLLWRDPETYEYKGLLAKTFKWASDTALEIELRQGVKFHNGQEMTADDVVYTLNFVIDPANGALQRNYVDWMKNVEKLGPYKVRINLEKPFPAAF
jgi:peptide/nickel transport system substrate-binding protein